MAKNTDQPKIAHRVVSNLRHNGKHYPKDKIVHLTAAEAKPLVSRKVVELAPAQAAPAPAPAPSNPEPPAGK